MTKRNGAKERSLHGQGHRFNPYSSHHSKPRSRRPARQPGQSRTLTRPLDTDRNIPVSTRLDSKVGKQRANGIATEWDAFWRRVA
jgi:hypothetical protein